MILEVAIMKIKPEVNFRQTPKRAQFRDLIGKCWAEPPFAEHFEPITKDRI